MSGLALSFSATALLVGCGGSSGDGDQNPALGAGGSVVGLPGAGGAPAVTTPPGTGATPVGPTGQAGATTVGQGGLPGAGGAPVLGAGGIPTGAGGAPVVSSSGGTTGVAGAPGAAGAGTAGAAGASGDTWTPTGNLDAMGNLIPPASADVGFQIKTTTFTLSPGQEVFNCFHATTPNTATFPVGEWDAQMSAGSHHFILYRADTDTTPNGTLVNFGCTAGFGGTQWLYTQGSPRSHLHFPDGVAMELTPSEKITFDMHYINTGTDVIQAHIILNVNKVTTAMYQKADAQVSFNTQIAIPPNGMQTVGGDCTPAAGANYFIMQTHTHKRGILAVINRKLANGMLGEELVRTTNWDNPQAHVWQAAPFLNFQSGEKFHYSCTYQNDRASLVTVGTSAENNEMCMAEAYFFPATGAVPGCS
ncbi:MAG TPA: hypothetical protein VH062_01710 [Polyangiaceae bacterium]|nr:hypothetical protein [Polyangiaceae bacterium]